MAIAENTTHLVGTQGVVEYGRSIKTRWIDLLNPPVEQPDDTRSADEIAADIWKNIRGQ